MITEKEKTTVPVPSVGADGEQPFSYVNDEIISTCGEESKPPLKWWFAQALEGPITGFTPKGALKVWHRITLTGRR